MAIDNDYSSLSWCKANITLPGVEFDDNSAGSNYSGYQSKLLLVVTTDGVPHLARFYIEMRDDKSILTYWNLEETADSLNINEVRAWAEL